MRDLHYRDMLVGVSDSAFVLGGWRRTLLKGIARCVCLSNGAGSSKEQREPWRQHAG